MRRGRTWFARLHPLIRLAVVVWVALLVGIGVRVATGSPRSHTVVPIYLTAAGHWVRGENLYGPYWPLDIYRNPPGVAAAFVPLTWVPERAAELLWRGLGAAVFLAGLGAWVRYGLPRPLSPGEAGAVFALAALPAIQSLNNGQTNLVIVGALLFGATAAARSRGLASGGWLALAAAIKVYPAAVGMLLAAGNPRRIAPAFAIACLGFAAIPFLLHNPSYVAEQYRNFRDCVTVDDRTFAELGRAPQDVFLFLRVWAVPPSPAVYMGFKLVVAAGMAGLVVLASRRVRDPRTVSALAFNLGCVWITALGPATEPQTYTILGPTAAAVLVLAVADRRSPGGLLRLGLAAAGYGLLAAPTIRDMFPNGGPFHAFAFQPIGGMLILAAVVWAGVRDLRRATSGMLSTTRSDECRSDPAPSARSRAA
jgi:hypothetical protein